MLVLDQFLPDFAGRGRILTAIDRTVRWDTACSFSINFPSDFSGRGRILTAIDRTVRWDTHFAVSGRRE